jgi:opacity protein-like surface antigen
MLKLIYSSLLSVLLLSTSFAGEAMNSSQVNKNDSNYYIGISTGSTDHSSTNSAGAAAFYTASDTNPKGHKITLGKNISSVWAIELSYVDLGVMQRYFDGAVDITNTQRTDAVDFNIVVKKEINYLIDNIYIKAGPSYIHTRGHAIRTPEGAFTRVKEIQQESHFGIHVGLGISKNIYKNIDLVFEVDKYSVDGNAAYVNETDNSNTNITDDNIHLYSLGINYKF